MCADAHLETNQLSRLIAELRQRYVRLVHSRYRRGYTVIILKRHANELFELTDAELAGYWPDVADTAAAIQRVFGAVGSTTRPGQPLPARPLPRGADVRRRQPDSAFGHRR
jgi:diadenosine tetraphosphate (Ap4A) HIT family hydrolase